ncbi:MAG TPA: lysophospholipid acyltransferase family protein [Thermoanaerobaculia bacterium]|jgi:1-acyl-sn-glycerol-3-phosphate acyltransferase|nr:lysophospholipid acyltransferase family protein [Thermoanaerobaculia bacterium]
MLRTVYLALAAVFVTIPMSTLTILVAIVRSTSPVIDWIVRTWGKALVSAAGIELRVEGLDRLDPNKRYILVSNHYSYLDIPCIVAAIPQPIRFMAKVSLFKIPIFGWAIGRAGFIPIDRKNRRTAVKSFELAADRIRKGNTIVIFPEEGRSRERMMRPFQRGAFLLAIKSEKTIVPVAIDSTYDVFRVGAKRVTPGVVTIKVGTPIETVNLKLRAKESLLQQAREQIETMLYGAPVTPPASPAAETE